jgi:hypothetical protein
MDVWKQNFALVVLSTSQPHAFIKQKKKRMAFSIIALIAAKNIMPIAM